MRAVRFTCEPTNDRRLSTGSVTGKIGPTCPPSRSERSAGSPTDCGVETFDRRLLQVERARRGRHRVGDHGVDRVAPRVAVLHDRRDGGRALRRTTPNTYSAKAGSCSSVSFENPRTSAKSIARTTGRGASAHPRARRLGDRYASAREGSSMSPWPRRSPGVERSPLAPRAAVRRPAPTGASSTAAAHDRDGMPGASARARHRSRCRPRRGPACRPRPRTGAPRHRGTARARG